MRLAIDLFCGLGGWTDGLLAEGYDVVGFDIERHRAIKLIQNRAQPTEVVEMRYPAQLVLQDVLTIHGSQFRDAAVIVASPPCQNYSYLAMPWSRSTDPENSKAAKALRKKWETEGPDNRLFDACFRIQREAIGATPCGNCGHHRLDHDAQYGCGACQKAEVCGGFRGRHIPLIVENVCGAQPWVGKAKANYGSFYLWGDVEQVGDRIFVGGVQFGAGLKVPKRAQKREGRNFHTWELTGGAVSSPPFNGGDHETRGVGMGQKSNPDGTNHPQCSWFRIADSSQGDRGVHLTSPTENEAGTKIGGDWFSDPNSTCRKHGSKSNARKQASALIAKIPLPLSRYVGEAFA